MIHSYEDAEFENFTILKDSHTALMIEAGKSALSDRKALVVSARRSYLTFICSGQKHATTLW